MELQLPSLAADCIRKNRRLSRVQGALAALLPGSIQRSEARSSERSRRSDVPAGGCYIGGSPRMEEPSQLLDQVGSKRHRQVLGACLAVPRDGGDQVLRDYQSQ